ncbi:Hsp20/alpha crystallin family protein [Thermopolyspora sp. NPDC052614]|uniref:Hsp20/alpha crystallin family protein n=1 Tax=Thermopolyspora sp. NPDC052614 TaxID=3155682 RepID=UPI0034431401
MSMLIHRRGRELGRLSPMREFEDLYERLGQLVSATMGEMAFPREGTDMPWVPFADVSETDDAYMVEADLPGVPKDQIDVQLSDRELCITGEVREEERERRHLRTRRTGRFEYRTLLPGDVETERVDARLRDGVLTVTIPKAQAAKPRRIEVSA